MSEHRIAPKKSFSQNFLNDQNISRKIVQVIDCQPGDIIIEIGPGTGALTEFLLKEESVTVQAIELDERAIEVLKDRFKKEEFPQFSIFEGDVRKFPLKEFAQQNEGRKIRIVGNIPYSITSDILFWIYEHSPLIEKAVIMMQREVAQRLVSPPRTKDYGVLAVATQLAGKAKMSFNVPPSCFFPQPRVTSTVVEFTPRRDELLKELYSPVMNVVRAAFSQRRKKISNATENFLKSREIDIPLIVQTAEKKGLKYFSQRAEELTPQDFIEFEQFIRAFKNDNGK
ncbi:MAG: 16S rRNA (adenine(1518)-N(6)/adenine(1519)-N(6))-dimethyltransferase RsmA [Bacteroidota bacterium]